MNGMRMNGSKGLRLAWPWQECRGETSDIWYRLNESSDNFFRKGWE